MAKLYLKFNSAVIKEIKLDKDAVTFGRKSDNDIVIDNPAVSGHHGKVFKENGDVWVEDLNSTNGTFINGRKISKEKLKNKDQVRIARHILEFVSEVAEPVAEKNQPEAPKPEAKKEPVKQAETPAPATNKGIPDQMGPHLIGDRPLPPAAGILKVISGAVDGRSEFKLVDLVTYIGTADQALIKIKGLLAPNLAAAISRRPEGYFLKAVKAGYPKVNGNPVKEQILLESGALIEVGSTNLMFYLNDDKEKKETPEPAPTPKKS